MDKSELEEIRKITDKGNPGNPEGDSGKQMLDRMNREHSDLTEWGLSWLEPDENGRILDIGCGGGAALARLIEENPGCTFYGIDHSPLSVAQTAAKNKDALLSGKLSVREGDVENLPYEDGFFERIYTIESFYFWPSAVGSLSEVYRVLKPGGRFLLISEIYENENLSDIARENVKKYSMRNPTAEEFEDYFEKAGFDRTQVRIHPVEGWITVTGFKNRK